MRKFYLFRRRRKQQSIIWFVVLFLIIFSTSCYWWKEFDSNNEEDLFQNQIKQLEFNDPIISKYINDPFNIHVEKIINEAKRKYQQTNEKYLVYSCRFMCGGKRERDLKEKRLNIVNE